jgi:hypothetical protein
MKGIKAMKKTRTLRVTRTKLMTNLLARREDSKGTKKLMRETLLIMMKMHPLRKKKMQITISPVY